MYTVYVIFNKERNKIYIGQTANLEERIEMHNNGAFKKSFTYKQKGTWILIYKEECIDRLSALKREKQLKSYRGREFVKKFIPL